MRETWGRVETAGQWPHPRPVWTLAVLVIALISAAAIQAYDCTIKWTPLQRWYVSAYLRSGLVAGLGFTGAGHYRLLHVVDHIGNRLALDAEVAPAHTSADIPFQLTDAAMRAGDRALVWHDVRARHQALHAFLCHWIYRDQPVVDLVRPAAGAALLV